jgi:hypothetical protein
MVIHETLLAACQEHPLAAVTEMVALVASAPADAPAGEIDVMHGAPCWFTVTVWPAIVTDPARGVLLVLAAIESVTAPLPLPEVPPDIVIHAVDVDAVQLHADPVVIDTVLTDAGDNTERLVVDNVKVQTGAACCTVNVRPPTVTVALRADADVFAAAL